MKTTYGLYVFCDLMHIVHVDLTFSCILAVRFLLLVVDIS